MPSIPTLLAATAALALAAPVAGAQVPAAEPGPAPAAPAPAPPPDAVAFGGHHYKVFDEVDGLSWQGGRDACAAAGGSLAVVTSEREADFVARLCDGRYLFLGASDADAEGQWTWVDGSPWEFTHWMKGQPNDYGGSEDFLATYDDGEWVDVEASGDDFWMPTGYICEWGD